LAVVEPMSRVAQQQVRNALHDLRAHNGHHAFEDLCRHLARRIINPNVLPATGPVGAGGDQGRDFETFRSFRETSGLNGFFEARATGIIAFACTLQTTGLTNKIRSDIRKIVSGGPVVLICVFTEKDISPKLRSELREWAKAEHEVELDIHDGHAIAEYLSDPVLYPIARQYLPVPPWDALHYVDSPRTARSQLPRGPRQLIGRDPEVGQVAGWLRSGPGAGGVVPSAVIVSGPPGAGKTALALSVAQLVAPDFPDGQYWIDVPDCEPGSEPAVVLSLLLGALEGDPARVPVGRQEQVFRLRSRLAEHKVLIALDGVGSEELLRELVAVSGPFALLVTSRSRLTGLGSDGVEFIDVGPLAEEDGARLASVVSGRLTVEESRELALACGGLPIAISIAAAQVARRPQLDVRRYLDQIASPDRGIEELSAGQRSVEAVIERSYRMLSPQQGQAMRALGVLPNAAIPAGVIAVALTEDVTSATSELEREATRLLDSLLELNLVEEPKSGQYRLHSILHRFARRKAATAVTGWREQVIGNACLAYMSLLESVSALIGYADEDARVPLESNAASIEALERDLPGAVMLVGTACQAKLWGRANDLARTLTPALEHLCRWEDVRQVYVHVREAGERTENSGWIAVALLNLGLIAARKGDTDEALGLYRECWEVASAAEDPFMANAAYASHGELLLSLGHVDEAIPVLRHALKVWRALGSDVLLMQTMHSMGMACIAKARLSRAELYFRNALKIAERSRIAKSLPVQGIALATVLRLTGRIDEARAECRTALERARAVGDRDAEAAALRETGILGDSAGVEDPLAAALEIFRDLGDARGELETLTAMGVSAESEGRTEDAARFFADCLDLAARVGDDGRAASSMAHLAVVRALAGQHTEAGELTELAENIAVQTGNGRLMAELVGHRAHLLRMSGNVAQAIPLLQRSARAQEAAGASVDLVNLRVRLGHALMLCGRWQEAFQHLKLVAEAPRDTAGAYHKASALRSLAVLYSRQQLTDEALEAARLALELARETGSAREEMDCIVTIGNVLARADQWADAAIEYERAAPIAADLRDMQTMATILSNQASCWLHAGDAGKAIRAQRAGIKIAVKLGMADFEASLRINLGASIAQQGDVPEAIAEFKRAHSMAAALADDTVRATAAVSLARAYHRQGDTEQARAAALEARGIFQAQANWGAAAEALLLELRDASPGTGAGGILAHPAGPGIPRGVLAALSAKLGPEPPLTESKEPSLHRVDRLTIRVADPVRAALRGFNVEDVCAQTRGRKSCLVCGLPIADTGNAEMMFVQGNPGQPDRVSLAHPACIQSAVVSLPSDPRDADMTLMEIECLVLANEMPAIVVDCRAPVFIGEDGGVTDPALDPLREMGFVDFRSILPQEHSPRFPLPPECPLQASLTRDKLTICSDSRAVIPGARLSFLPRWYRATRTGTLVVMFGRNLQGMVYDDQKFLIEAASSGNLVIAALRVEVTRPSKNAKCVCTPRTNLKFKHCCGRRL
jgi:tetratricopeptide (TPR) repeat protein